MCYALPGIPLCLIMFQSIGERMNTIITYMLQNINYVFKLKKTISQTYLMLVSFTIGSTVLTIGAAVFSSYEGWVYLDSFYYCFVTLTTIGFGDFVALQHNNSLSKKPDYVAFSLIFILFGLTVVSSVMNLLVLRFLTMNTEDERRDKIEAAAHAHELQKLKVDFNWNNTLNNANYCPELFGIHNNQNFFTFIKPDEVHGISDSTKCCICVPNICPNICSNINFLNNLQSKIQNTDQETYGLPFLKQNHICDKNVLNNFHTTYIPNSVDTFENTKNLPVLIENQNNLDEVKTNNNNNFEDKTLLNFNFNQFETNFNYNQSLSLKENLLDYIKDLDEIDQIDCNNKLGHTIPILNNLENSNLYCRRKMSKCCLNNLNNYKFDWDQHDFGINSLQSSLDCASKTNLNQIRKCSLNPNLFYHHYSKSNENDHIYLNYNPIPIIPSHCCIKNANDLYLDFEMLNFKNLRTLDNSVQIKSIRRASI